MWSRICWRVCCKKQIFIEKPQRFAKIEFSLDDLRNDLLNNQNFLKKFKERVYMDIFNHLRLVKIQFIWNNWW